MANWNPWHGCRKLSEGCLNCYVYRTDARYEKDSTEVTKNKCFDLPVRKNKNGGYIFHPSDTVYTCFTSDFFVPDADAWRPDAWRIIAERDDLHFLIITKRPDRFFVGLPDEVPHTFTNLTLCCTTENQRRADERLDVFTTLPVKSRYIICEPLLEHIDLTPWLTRGIEGVVAGGESGHNARECRWEWLQSLRAQCVSAGVAFTFKQTGANFVKDNHRYVIERRLQHAQARKASINYIPKGRTTAHL